MCFDKLSTSGCWESGNHQNPLGLSLSKAPAQPRPHP